MKMPRTEVYGEEKRVEELPLFTQQEEEATPRMKVETEPEKVEKQLIVPSNISKSIPKRRPELILDYLPEGSSVGQIYGESGAGKTFVAVSMVGSLTSNIGKWLGKKCRTNCRVAYLTKEGQNNLFMRFKAWCKYHHVDERIMDNNLFFLDVDYSSSIYMDMESEEYKTLLKNLQENGPFDVVFLDTYAEFSKGQDENAKGTAQEFINAMKKIADTLNACVIMIHHPKKFDKIENSDPSYVPDDGRGSGAVKGALDVQISIGGKIKDGSAKLTIVKSKDGDKEGKESQIQLKSEVVTFEEYGIDEWSGRYPQSLVVVDTDLIKILTKDERNLKNTIEEGIDTGEVPYTVLQMPNKICPFGRLSFRTEDFFPYFKKKFLGEGTQQRKAKRAGLPYTDKDLNNMINPNRDEEMGKLAKAGLIDFDKKKNARGATIEPKDNYSYSNEDGVWKFKIFEEAIEKVRKEQQEELEKLKQVEKQ